MSEGQTTPVFPAPKTGQPYIEVSALEAGVLEIPTYEIVSDAGDDEILHAPSLAFSLRHFETGKHLLFDLGIRRESVEDDPTVTVKQSSDESLKKGGINPEDVETIILSHLHWDHVGKSSEFPKATFIIGPGCEEVPIEAGCTEPFVLPASAPKDRTRILNASVDFHTSVGPFSQAYDYFGDGSLYIINAAGHFKGHINVLARTSSDGSWILLGGDTAHDVRLLTGEKEMTHRLDPKGHLICAHDHKEDAERHIKRVGSLLKVPKVQVLIAHDWEWYEKNKGGQAFLPGKIPPKED